VGIQAKQNKKSNIELPAMAPGTLVEVVIERILPGGLGLAHANGRTIMVALSAPGDRALVEIERSRDAVSWGRIVEILEPSPSRIEPACPYFGRCGGCDFQQLTYDAQLAAKVEIVRDCLRRITKIDPPEHLPITPSPTPWHYRYRAMWQRDAAQNLLGYYQRGSRVVCDVVYCPVLAPEMQETLREVRHSIDIGQAPPDARDFQAVIGDRGPSVVPPLTPDESLETQLTLGGFTYRFSAEGFFQINQKLLPELIHAAVEPLNGDSALDLYCGVGLFTLPLAQRFKTVTGVESNSAAIGYARENAAAAGFANVEFASDTVSGWLRRNAGKHSPVSAVLLDPPRVGAEKATIRGILELNPRQISYVSCDPATLARDLKSLLQGGYELKSVAAFDMFPQTHHIETVVHLSR
jgi:23S rRNA (uracil1939-C5)-methyltransferase